MKLLVVVQARVGSTRLPGKVLLPLSGKPALERQIERIRAAETPFDIVVATTLDDRDDPICALCRTIDVDCFRGHPTDLLDRHYRAGLAAGADAVAKIPSDCPLIDPGAIDRVLRAFTREPGAWDLVTNLRPPTYPDGNDVEVLPMSVLEQAHREAKRPFEREHTTPFVWDQPERFRIKNVRWETGLDYSRSHRLTMDYPDDYRLARTLYDRLFVPEDPVFRLPSILEAMDQPEVRAINAAHAGASWHLGHLGELRSVRLESGVLQWN